MRRRHRSVSTTLDVGRYRLDTNQSRISIRTLRNNLLADEGSKWARTQLVLIIKENIGMGIPMALGHSITFKYFKRQTESSQLFGI